MPLKAFCKWGDLLITLIRMAKLEPSHTPGKLIFSIISTTESGYISTGKVQDICLTWSWWDEMSRRPPEIIRASK